MPDNTDEEHLDNPAIPLVEAMLNKDGKLPVNVKYLFEGDDSKNIGQTTFEIRNWWLRRGYDIF